MVQEHEDEEREGLARAARERAETIRRTGSPAFYAGSALLSAVLSVVMAGMGIVMVDEVYTGKFGFLIIAGIVFVLFQALHFIYGMYLVVKILSDIRSCT
jgi:hypothetical protein